ncbi:MAG: 1-(5-phosphoribosyl)-5-[(5-phosphoribosylamino)methylideneamino]imidazole-4-carboxamide isomerase [Prevotella sp.]
MIELIPAIDIIDGKCVRLTKGDYNEKTVYADTPVQMARKFEALGFRRLHVVDLEGAKSKHIVNVNVLREITESTSLTVDFGGGIKSEDDIRKAFDNGAAMVTVGSVAVTDRALFSKWLDTFGPERIVLGADVRNGKISINGWKEDSDEDIISFLDYYVRKGITNVLCTDISKDGTLAGPAFGLYEKILETFPKINLIASGGVSCAEDLKRLDAGKVPSAILGKAVYEGKIDITTILDEIRAARQS